MHLFYWWIKENKNKMIPVVLFTLKKIVCKNLLVLSSSSKTASWISLLLVCDCNVTEGKWLTFSSGFFCVTMPWSPIHSFLRMRKIRNKTSFERLYHTHSASTFANLLVSVPFPAGAQRENDDHNNDTTSRDYFDDHFLGVRRGTDKYRRNFAASSVHFN